MDKEYNQYSQYDFITEEWPDIKKLVTKIEKYSNIDPEITCLYARKTTEYIVKWMYQYEDEIINKYKADRSLSYQIHDFGFKNVVGEEGFSRFKFIKDLGNRAAHLNDLPPNKNESIEVASELFKICKWFHQRYSSNPSAVVGRTFKKENLPKKANESFK